MRALQLFYHKSSNYVDDVCQCSTKTEGAIIYYFFWFYCFAFSFLWWSVARRRGMKSENHTQLELFNPIRMPTLIVCIYFSMAPSEMNVLCLVFGSTHSYNSEVATLWMGKRDQMTCTGQKKRETITTNVKKRKQRICRILCCCTPLGPTTFHNSHMLVCTKLLCRPRAWIQLHKQQKTQPNKNHHHHFLLSRLGCPWLLAMVCARVEFCHSLCAAPRSLTRVLPLNCSVFTCARVSESYMCVWLNVKNSLFS